MEQPITQLLTNERVAELLGVKMSTLWKWVRQGTFPPPDICRVRFSRYRPETFAKGVEMLRTGSRCSLTAPEPAPNQPVVPERLDAALQYSQKRKGTPRQTKAGGKRTPFSPEQKQFAIQRYAETVGKGLMTVPELLVDLKNTTGISFSKSTVTNWYCLHKRKA